MLVPDRRAAGTLLCAYLYVVGLIVFSPTADVASGSVHGIRAVLVLLGVPGFVTPWHVEFITNVLLFVPLSALGATLRPRWGWRQWGLVGLAGTLLIELSQLALLAGRSAQLADVLANLTGAVLGYALARSARSDESPEG